MAEASKWHRRIFEDFNVYFFKRHFIHMQKILPALQNYLSQKSFTWQMQWSAARKTVNIVSAREILETLKPKYCIN